MPELVSLDFPDTIDLSDGNTLATFSASATDPDGIDSVFIVFDRNVTKSYSTSSSATFSSSSATGIYGFGTDDWSDGASSETIQFSGATRSGVVEIRQLWVEDITGDRRIYENDELRALGFKTSFTVEGTPLPEVPTAHATLSLPDVITIREGESVQGTLALLGLTSHVVS